MNAAQKTAQLEAKVKEAEARAAAAEALNAQLKEAEDRTDSTEALKAQLEAAEARATAAESVLEKQTRKKIIPGAFSVKIQRPTGKMETLKLKMREPSPPKISITKSVSGLQTTFVMLTEDFVALAQGKAGKVKNANAASIFVEDGKTNDLFKKVLNAYAKMWSPDSNYFQLA